MRSSWQEIVQYTDYLKFQDRLRKHRKEFLLFCQHPPTITAGIKSRPESLIYDEDELSRQGIGLYSIRRGGDFTAHEMGQLCIYPHVDLRMRKILLGFFFQGLLKITQETLQQTYGITTESSATAPGLYTADGAKIASIGVDARQFFTSHGIAVNLSNSGQTFAAIHPCGQVGQQITSVQACGGEPGKEMTFRKNWQERLAYLLSSFHHHTGIH